MSGITEHDMDSVREAVGVLEDAGFTVDGLDDVERVNHGVRFSVSAVANTRTKSLKDSE
jgi:hypothetical protein